jgi:hypothetical protein
MLYMLDELRLPQQNIMVNFSLATLNREEASDVMLCCKL